MTEVLYRIRNGKIVDLNIPTEKAKDFLKNMENIKHLRKVK